jgi:hypothetical protein
MLTQGVTTEILNPDGFGTVDLREQTAMLMQTGLALNIGAYIGFNAVWQAVVGLTDRRPTQDDVTRMRVLVERGLEHGAWGVSAGLDYVPGRYASTDEVVSVVEVGRKWRTNFPNHERLIADAGVRAGISETIAIARAAGLMPVITHVKAGRTGDNRAPALVDMMTAATKSGLYTAADAYPYVAGMGRPGALLIPGWAQEGGRGDMLKRFADPTQRARIVTETEQMLAARLGGAESVTFLRGRGELVELMKSQNVSAGEAILRMVEQADAGAIMRFGVESDVVTFLRHPTTSVACDCGASISPFVHPRFYGTYPRVLGRYVREQKVLTWAEAVYKMTALPSATIGMIDRGVLAVGMAADVTVFDPDRVVDRATYENPTLLSEGIRHVIINGRVALRDGKVTGLHAGRILNRAGHMPSRPTSFGVARRIVGRTQDGTVEVDVKHDAGDRLATGVFRVRDSRKNVTVTAIEVGVVQVADRWAAFSGRARLSPPGTERPFTVIIDQADPFQPGAATLRITVDGALETALSLPTHAVRITP